MKPIKCGDCKMFYDGDKYDSCPHCKAAEAGEAPLPKRKSGVSEKRSEYSLPPTHKPPENPPVSTGSTGRINSLLGRVKRHGSDSDGTDTVDRPDKVRSRKTGRRPFDKDFSLLKSVEKGTAEYVSSDDESLTQNDELPKTSTDMHTEERIEQPTAQEDVAETQNTVVNSENEGSAQEERHIVTSSVLPAVAPANATSEASTGNSIAEAIKQADSTAGAFDQKTVAFYNFSNSVEPVVGWLVCIKGMYKGESFNIKSGRNNIGRSQGMDIALAQEKSVSRERHASITFEPHQKKFFVQAGESSGLTYVNDEILMTFKELSDYDRITLGESEFVFLRLVGEKFSWEKYD